jgi:hypothetical protein
VSETLLRHADSLRRGIPLAALVRELALGPYRGYAELVDEWCELSALGARVLPIGETVRGTPSFALEFGPSDASRVSVVLGGIHPIEWIGVEVAHGLLARIAACPPIDRRILVVPLVNPDGYQRVELDLRSGKRRWRRTNANGVDLNRNWPTHFAPRGRLGKLMRGYSKSGPAALSEPETANVVAMLDDVARSARLDRAVSLHSIGRMILVPYGGVWRRPANHAATMRAARRVQAAIRTRYTIRQTARWVPGAFARGMELDHLHDAYGATALLVECTYGGASVRAPRRSLHPFRIYNPRNKHAAVATLLPALEQFVRGMA